MQASSARGYCLAIVGAVFFWTVNVAVAADQNVARPNIVLIVIDDFGWTDLGCYGSKYYQFAQRRPAGRRRYAVHSGLCRLPGLLADAGGTDDRQISGAAASDRLHSRQAQQPTSSSAAARFSPGAAAGGNHRGGDASRSRLRDRLDRQVAHGRARVSSRRGKVSSSAWAATAIGSVQQTTLLRYLDRAANSAAGPGQRAAGRIPCRPADDVKPRSSSRPTAIGRSFLYLPHYAVHTPIMAPSR